MKAFKKAGFEQYGCYPKMRWFDGEWKDEYLFAIINEEMGSPV